LAVPKQNLIGSLTNRSGFYNAAPKFRETTAGRQHLSEQIKLQSVACGELHLKIPTPV